MQTKIFFFNFGLPCANYLILHFTTINISFIHVHTRSSWWPFRNAHINIPWCPFASVVGLCNETRVWIWLNLIGKKAVFILYYKIWAYSDILSKHRRDEILMTSYKCCCFSSRYSNHGCIEGDSKIGCGRALLWHTSSHRMTTATHRNVLKGCGLKGYCSEVNFVVLWYLHVYIHHMYRVLPIKSHKSTTFLYKYMFRSRVLFACTFSVFSVFYLMLKRREWHRVLYIWSQPVL